MNSGRICSMRRVAEELPGSVTRRSTARVKRVVAFDLDGSEASGMVTRLASIDLMEIADPKGRARIATDAAAPREGRFTFPFVTIEDVVQVDPEHILVINDNNLPFSAGRALDRADSNEFMLLSGPELLAAAAD